MHYGIDVAVPVKTFTVINSVFINFKMLPLWSILNIKETKQIVVQNVTFYNFSFQVPQSSNGFIINILNFDVNSEVPDSVIQNVLLTNTSTNFFQIINAQSFENNITGSLAFSNLTVVNNNFDAPISLIYLSSFYLFNANFSVTFDDSFFINNTFAVYGDIIAIEQNMALPVLVKDTQFINNFGAMFDLTSGNIALTQYPTQLMVENCTFIQNTPYSKALIVVNENCKTYIYNSDFLENYSVARGSVIMADYQGTKNYFENCTFINNSAAVGGVFYTQFTSLIDCLNCTVQNNFGVKGGVVYTSNDGYIQFRKSKILQNKSLYSSLLVTLSSPTTYNMFQNSFISQNQLLSLSQFVDASGQANNTVAALSYVQPSMLQYIIQNTLSIDIQVSLGLIYAINSIGSNLQLQNLTIDSQQNILSCFQATILGSNVTIQNTEVSSTENLLELTSTTFNISGLNLLNITCDVKTAAINNYLLSAQLQTYFYVKGLYIKNTTNPIIFMLSSTMNLSDSVIQSITVQSELYQPLSFTDSTAGIINLTIIDATISPNSMISLSFTDMDAYQLQMSNINQTYMTASDSTLNLTYSNLSRNFSSDPRNVTAEQLQLISLTQSAMIIQTTTLLMNGSLVSGFFSNDMGGGIYTTNCPLINITNSFFQNNFALQGGAIELYCDTNQICTYEIQNSTFQNNIGVAQGAGIDYNYFAPIINLASMDFSGNQAPYGQDISAYPFQIVVTNPANINEQVSGQTIVNPISVEIQDYYGNIIANDNSTKVQLQSVNITAIQIQGASTLTVTNGQATFDSVTLLSNPGSVGEFLQIVFQQYNNAQVATAYNISDPSSLNSKLVNFDLVQT